jgi:tetratricopeptide (TPR) repeat protein
VLSLALLLAPPAHGQAAPPAVIASQPAVVRAEAAALLLSGQQGGTIRAALLATALAPAVSDGADGLYPVAVLAEIAGAELLRPAQIRAGIELFLYVLSGDGRAVLAADSRRLAVNAEEHGPRLRDTGLRWTAHFELPAGNYLVRLLARTDGGALGLWSEPLTVPAPAAEVAGWRPLGPPLFAEEGGWLAVAPAAAVSDVAVSDVAAPGTTPVSVSGVEALRAAGFAHPAARPVLVPGERRVLVVLGSGQRATQADAPAGTTSSAGLLLAPKAPNDGAAEPMLPPRVELTPERTLPLPDGAIAWSLALGELASGEYEARWVGGSGPNAVVSPPATVWIHAEATRPWPRLAPEGELSNAAAPRSAAGPKSPPAPPGGEAPPPVEELAPRQWATTYRAVLARLAREGAAGAYPPLRELEQQVLEREGAAAADRLDQVRQAVWAPLALERCRCFLAIFRLHQLAAERYPQELPLLSGNALDGAAQAAELALGAEEPASEATASEATASEETVARALALLADRAGRRGQYRNAAQLYARALKLAPADAAIRLALAALHEKNGAYAEAVAALEGDAGRGQERGIGARIRPPASEGAEVGDEARLRLALNLLRIDRREPGERLLRRLVASQSSGWPALVAYQELARRHAAAGDAAEARRLLEAALGRWPQDPTAGVQLAYLEVAAGRGAPAAQQLVALERAAGGTQSTARDRYNRWPEVMTPGQRAALAASCEAQRPALERALGLVPAGSAPFEPVQTEPVP